jgi:osmotically-inducible protein OsmY
MTLFLWRTPVRTAVVTLLTTAAVLTALGGCAPLMVGGMASTVMVASDRRTSGTQLEDEGIEIRAGNRLRELLGDRGHLNITSYNRQVLLTGEVPTDEDKQRVEKAVSGVDNVQSVVNELGVMGTSSFSQRSSDTLVTTRVKASLVDAKDLMSNAFKVVTERGTVYLMGRVTEREAQRVTQIARTVQGSQRVVRLLEIISEDELARLQPKSAPASNTSGASSAPTSP